MVAHPLSASSTSAALVRSIDRQVGVDICSSWPEIRSLKNTGVGRATACARSQSALTNPLPGLRQPPVAISGTDMASGARIGDLAASVSRYQCEEETPPRVSTRCAHASAHAQSRSALRPPPSRRASTPVQSDRATLSISKHTATADNSRRYLPTVRYNGGHRSMLNAPNALAPTEPSVATVSMFATFSSGASSAECNSRTVQVAAPLRYGLTRRIRHEDHRIGRFQQGTSTRRETRLSGHADDLAANAPTFEQPTCVIQPVEVERSAVDFRRRLQRAAELRRQRSQTGRLAGQRRRRDAAANTTPSTDASHQTNAPTCLATAERRIARLASQLSVDDTRLSSSIRSDARIGSRMTLVPAAASETSSTKEKKPGRTARPAPHRHRKQRRSGIADRDMRIGLLDERPAIGGFRVDDFEQRLEPQLGAHRQSDARQCEIACPHRATLPLQFTSMMSACNVCLYVSRRARDAH